MAKWQNDSVLDAALDHISVNATEMYICAGQPISRADAISKALIAAVVPTFAAKSNGAVSGRKVSVDQKADQAITVTGDADHIALCSGIDLLFVTTDTLQNLTAGGTVTIPAWNIEFRDVIA